MLTVEPVRRMMKLVSLIVPAVFTAASWAHPPVSVVMDRRGTVFYSDLSDVWMIIPDRTRTFAVSNVHTHELWMDSRDVLYGKDIANVGSVIGTGSGAPPRWVDE